MNSIFEVVRYDDRRDKSTDRRLFKKHEDAEKFARELLEASMVNRTDLEYYKNPSGNYYVTYIVDENIDDPWDDNSYCSIIITERRVF